MRLIILLCALMFAWRYHLPEKIPNQQNILIGTIISVPEWQYHAWHFIFKPQQFNNNIFVSWYSPPPVTLSVGDKWQLKLKITSTPKNWLLAQHIINSATVLMDYHNQLLAHHPWQFPINHIRQILYQQLQMTLPNNPYLGFISALVVGIRDDITEPQWNDLRATGTNHLMAIAGLHIGFLFEFIYLLSNYAWRLSTKLMLFIPAQEAAALFGLLAAMLYSALAGFALPTQRAIIMLSVFISAKICRYPIAITNGWIIALCIILAWNPFVLFTASFWLSFTAVGFLMYCHYGRLRLIKVWHLLQAQWVIALGLIPLSLYFFQQVSLIGIIANMIAIPFIGFIILPISLVGVLFSPLSMWLSEILWKFAAYLISYFWPLMHWLANLPYLQWQQTINNPWLILSTTIAIVILLAPRGWPHRWLSLLWLMPLILRH